LDAVGPRDVERIARNGGDGHRAQCSGSGGRRGGPGGERPVGKGAFRAFWRRKCTAVTLMLGMRRDPGHTRGTQRSPASQGRSHTSGIARAGVAMRRAQRARRPAPRR
jgi:hypothetical protein